MTTPARVDAVKRTRISAVYVVPEKRLKRELSKCSGIRGRVFGFSELAGEKPLHFSD
jgi:hypothetical protein